MRIISLSKNSTLIKNLANKIAHLSNNMQSYIIWRAISKCINYVVCTYVYAIYYYAWRFHAIIWSSENESTPNKIVTQTKQMRKLLRKQEVICWQDRTYKYLSSILHCLSLSHWTFLNKVSFAIVKCNEQNRASHRQLWIFEQLRITYIMLRCSQIHNTLKN